jgi:hypothetical protein
MTTGVEGQGSGSGSASSQGRAPVVASWLRLVGRLQFGLLPLFFFALPLTACRRVIGHDLLGGMFVELSPMQVFLTVIPLVLCAWSTMLVIGLLVEGSKLDPPAGLPAWSRVFDVPARAATFFAFPVLALPAVVIVVAWSPARGAASAAAVGGALVAYVVAMAVTGLLNAAEPGYDVAPAPLARWLVRGLAGSARLGRFMRWLRRLLGRLTFPPFDGAWDPPAQAFDIDHFMAAGFCAATVAVFLIEAYVFRPWTRVVTSLPSAALLLTLGTLLVWILGALAFHLRRYRLSPVPTLIAAGAIGYLISGYDHHFLATRRNPFQPLSAVQLASTVGDGNLVVVASAGGGITAAGWTTLALQQLIAARPALVHEIRLLSGVSGGSVGAVFYVAGLREDGALGRPARALSDVLAEAHARSVSSSLDAVAYGLVFFDFPRFLTGNLAFGGTQSDRGDLLETRWRDLAAGIKVPLHSLADQMGKGALPGLILNTTAMETGRRVMVTPLQFGTPDQIRAPTLDEYLSAPVTGTQGGDAAAGASAETRAVDLDLWTAARLSATFPYVSPAARAMIDGAWGAGAAGHHMIDGGYNENYGVASALDFLAPVVEARRLGQLHFRRLLIVQLRAWNARSPVPRPTAGIAASLAGPLIGVLSVRDGATLPRNQAALKQFIELWDGQDGLDVRSVVFEPRPPGAAASEDDEEPLSWHMTEAQKRSLRGRWFAQSDLTAKICVTLAFLNGADAGGCGVDATGLLERSTRAGR